MTPWSGNLTNLSTYYTLYICKVTLHIMKRRDGSKHLKQRMIIVYPCFHVPKIVHKCSNSDVTELISDCASQSIIIFTMSNTARSSRYPHTDRILGLADVANIFELAASRLLAIRIELGKTKLVTSSKVRLIVTKYLMWEGDVSSSAGHSLI